MTKDDLFKILDKHIYNICNTFSAENCRDALTDQLIEANFPFSWSLETGISKAVLLLKGESYVIKLPFYCIFNEEAYEESCQEWEEGFDQFIEKKSKNEIIPSEQLREYRIEYCKNNPNPDDNLEAFYYELEGATYIPAIEELQDGPDWDYCNTECAIYKKAVERGLGAYFAEEGLLGALKCGHPVYYQQRCISLSSLEVDYDSYDYQQKSEKIRKTCAENEIFCFNPLWISDFLEHYGFNEFKRLNDFLEEMNIQDLRDCNIGYLDGAPILFDYSGFRYWD